MANMTFEEVKPLIEQMSAEERARLVDWLEHEQADEDELDEIDPIANFREAWHDVMTGNTLSWEQFKAELDESE